MKKTLSVAALIATLGACQSGVIKTGPSYPPVSPDMVQMSFASAPNCAAPQEVGLISQVGSNKFAQERAMNVIRSQAASNGANLVLLKTTATSLLGDMLIDAVMYRCA